jgi:hypothetical protein
MTTANDKVAALAVEARRLVATWPTLTVEQRDHVAAVLTAAGGAR